MFVRADALLRSYGECKIGGGERVTLVYIHPAWADTIHCTKPRHNYTDIMVKITFQAVSAQKPEKENDEDKIQIPRAHVS